jgi:hypothetical protein
MHKGHTNILKFQEKTLGIHPFLYEGDSSCETPMSERNMGLDNHDRKEKWMLG